MKADQRFTKLLGEHILNAKGFYEYGLDKKLIDREALKYTIEARQKIAAKLVEGGMSQRKAAKALGVSQSTLQRDVTHNGSKTTHNGSVRAVRDDLPPGAELTNATTEIMARAVEKFQLKFYEWLETDPPGEARQSMLGVMEGCLEILRTLAAEIKPGEEE
jgi:DNA-binding CsgD family transcriptional regulator